MEETVTFYNIVNTRNVAATSKFKFLNFCPQQELSVYEITALLKNPYVRGINCNIHSNQISYLNSEFISTLDDNCLIIEFPQLEKMGVHCKFLDRNRKILHKARKRFLKDRIFHFYAILRFRIKLCKDICILLAKTYYSTEYENLYPDIKVVDLGIAEK